jgi:nitrogen fixation/metabolism regulation signal transduction histidine kinase
MKRLVNEFRDYARLPSADLKPLDLNALVMDVMGLYTQDHKKQTQR